MKWFVVLSLVCFSAPVYLWRDEPVEDFDSYVEVKELNEKQIEKLQIIESLSRAIKTDDVETLKTILKSNEGLLNGSKDITTLIYVAAMEGSLDVIKYLVAEQHDDVDVDYSIYKCLIPLYEDVKAGKLEAVKRLMELGADSNMTFRIYGNTLLHEAATGYSVEILKFLFSFFIIDERNAFGQTPAYLAARTAKSVALRFLLQNGADPYARDKYGDTLMHAAVRSGQVDVMRELTPYKQLINISNDDNNLPIEIISNKQVVKELVNSASIITDKSIFYYVLLNKYDIAKYLVEESGKVNIRNIWDARPCRGTLLTTILTKKILPYDMIKFMLDRGADVNIKYCKNITALHITAFYEKELTLEVIKLLLDKGADVNSPDVRGYTPLDYAISKENHAVYEYLRSFGAVARDGVDSLYEAAEVDDLETVKKIIESDKFALRGLRNGYTVLHIAAIGGSLNVIQYLVREQLYDINVIPNNFSLSPLGAAAKAGKLEAVQLLLELGADKNIPYFDGYTLLHLAAIGGNVEVCKLLLQTSHVDVRNELGDTPAYLAARNGNVDALRFLLENGADPHARDSDNSTMMHTAVKAKLVDVVRELARYKQLFNTPDAMGDLPIEIISNMEVVEVLVDAGSNITDKCIWRYVDDRVIIEGDVKVDKIKYLVEKSGKVNIQTPTPSDEYPFCKNTLLTHIIENRANGYIIESLLKLGADVNVKNCINETPLHIAVRSNKFWEDYALDAVKVLVEGGADVNALTVSDDTPLDYAKVYQFHKMVEYLRKFGAE